MRLLASLLGLLLAVSTAHASSIEVRLIRASNNAPTDDAVKEAVPRLKKIFGFQHYRLLGKDKQEIKGREVVKLNMGEGFTLFCHPRDSEDKTVVMDVEIYSGRTLLVKQDKLKLHEKKAVFVKGPEVGSDWLIVELRVAE